MSCKHCNGTGFLITERPDGASGAARCSCRRFTKPPGTRPEPIDFARAVLLMAGMIPFFPKEEVAHAFIAQQLSESPGIESEQDLDRFVSRVCSSVKKWEGYAALWAVYEQVSIADYQAAEFDAADRRLEEYRRRALAAPANEREPFLLPAAKTM